MSKGVDVPYSSMASWNWVVFGVLTLVLISGVVWLARLTAQAIGEETSEDGEWGRDAELSQIMDGSRWFLYGNVVVSHGIFGVLLIGVAWTSHIPIAAFSIGEMSRDLVGLGIGVGVVLFGVSESVKSVMPREQLVYSEHLRELLAPTSRFEWVGLVGGVLPVVAVVEEVLFRAALIGAFSYGFGVSPWLLAIGSSILFGIGHGIQGRGGIVATGLLGGLLAVVFIVTNSLIVVIIAHYLINVLEFSIHEFVTDLVE